MQTCIYIVRHTETTGNVEQRLTGRTDFEVTEKGKLAIRKLTKRLSGVRFDSMYSSTSGRTYKTIAELAKINGIEIQQLEDLCEMDFGIYDGWKWSDVNQVAPEIKENQNKINEIFGIPEQESMEDLADRMYDCITRLAEENQGKTILICSHGVAIEAFMRKIVGLKFRYERERFCQHNTAVNRVVYENGSFEIKEMADMSHLNDDKRGDVPCQDR